jgi:predicted MFS family arabinose efflux permease
MRSAVRRSEAARFGLRADGAAVGPLVVLSGLNLVDELDRIGFATLAPEIRDALGVSDGTIVSISSGAGALAILLAVPVGYLADRVDRVRLSIAGALIWAAALVATGLAQVVAVLAAARFASGAGRLVNDPVHASLLADYYPARSLPSVSAIHRSATSIGAVVAGPCAGLLAAAVGWRAALVVLALPTLVLAAAATRLRDPALSAGRRRRTEVVALREAWRTLRRKKSMTRIWVVAFFYGAAFIPLVASLLSVFFDRAYGLGPGARGSVLSVFGVGGLIGLLAGRHFAARAMRRDDAAALMRTLAWSVTAFGGFLLLFAVVDAFPASVVLVLLAAVGAYGYIPAYLTLVALIAESHHRAQAYAYSLFFFALGGLLAARMLPVVLEGGVRPALVGLGICALCGAFIAQTAPRVVPRDVVRSRD